MRLHCLLFGCAEADEPCAPPHCHYCGTDLYDGMRPFRQSGWLTPMLDWWHRLRQWTWPRCWHCDRLLVFRRKVDERFCSEQCRKSWIPF